MTDSSVLASLSKALESLDAPRLVDHYAEDAEVAETVDRQVVKGKPALLSMYQRLFSLPGTRFTVTIAFMAQDLAAIEWIWESDNPKSGQHLSVPGASISKLEHGKVSRETIYYDGRQAPV